MDMKQQRAVMRLGSRLFNDALAAAQSASDGVGSETANAAYYQLAGVLEAMQAAGLRDSDAGNHCAVLIERLNHYDGCEDGGAFWAV